MYKEIRGVIIADTDKSAIAVSSREWARRLNADLFFALDFPMLSKLINKIEAGKYEWVLFSWRGSLEKIVEDKYLLRKLNSLGRILSIYFSVPDHLDLVSIEQGKLKNIYRYADGFTVVSQRLLEIYRGFEHLPISPQLLPDFPDTQLLEEVCKIQAEKKYGSVIWVGNSKWGKKLGITDHKGFQNLVLPVKTELSKRNEVFKFSLIDRGKNYLPHRKTLEFINNSQYLLQTSKSEGTGLPLLEALALGTFPITTDVGVNREVFKGDWTTFHADTPEQFVEALISNLDVTKPRRLKKFYDEYLGRISKIAAQVEFKKFYQNPNIQSQRTILEEDSRIDFAGRFYWTMRFLYGRLRSLIYSMKARDWKVND